jgi:hypothetical protein
MPAIAKKWSPPASVYAPGPFSSKIGQQATIRWRPVLSET